MVRYFMYIDVSAIESFYNQVQNNFSRKIIHKAKENEMECTSKVTFTNLLRGILDFEGQFRALHKRMVAEDIEYVNTIEAKIEKVLEIADGNEMQKIDVDKLNESKKIICGKVKILEEKLFVNKASQYFKCNIKNYSEFMRKYRKKKKIYKKWKRIGTLEFLDNGTSVLKIMSSWCYKNEECTNFIITDNEVPILMQITNKKITITHSSLFSSGLFATTNEFHVLGILENVSGNYTLKPFALWKNMSNEKLLNEI